MSDDRDDLGGRVDPATDELDRLRLALLHERSRAERAEEELAALRAERTPEGAAVASSAGPAPARKSWRRR